MSPGAEASLLLPGFWSAKVSQAFMVMLPLLLEVPTEPSKGIYFPVERRSYALPMCWLFPAFPEVGGL